MVQAEHHVFKVQRVGGGDIDQLHLRILHQFQIAAVGPPETEFPGKGTGSFQIYGSNGCALDFLQPAYAGNHRMGNGTCAENT